MVSGTTRSARATEANCKCYFLTRPKAHRASPGRVRGSGSALKLKLWRGWPGIRPPEAWGSRPLSIKLRADPNGADVRRRTFHEQSWVNLGERQRGRLRPPSRCRTGGRSPFTGAPPPSHSMPTSPPAVSFFQPTAASAAWSSTCSLAPTRRRCPTSSSFCAGRRGEGWLCSHGKGAQGVSIPAQGVSIPYVAFLPAPNKIPPKPSPPDRAAKSRRVGTILPAKLSSGCAPMPLSIRLMTGRQPGIPPGGIVTPDASRKPCDSVGCYCPGLPPLLCRPDSLGSYRRSCQKTLRYQALSIRTY